ncbi:MAG: polyphosphate polymerase domain-containing protein [Clostridia bacterium]|nr:polyphosphate polymerase domain-containing protein [Clostridia bacterium]MDD3972029.1 polyphosphate polymerase domain-containing protein [Clostridia bacterium]MDD4542700.1 polyphosphate polymerase domain-containing protein [Clostridia bacterium]
MKQVLRQEKKYLISKSDYIKYSAAFNTYLAQDENNGEHGYTVRSLYFDTLFDNDFNEKEEGVEIRRKIRLRIYKPTDEFASLEMKQKQGSQQLKRSLKMSKEDAILLTKGVYGPLLNYKESFAKEIYGVMNMRFYRPKAIVEYNRKAFIAKENSIRITFDHNIRATESCFDIFSDKLNLYPVFSADGVVLEVKYNGFLLSYIKDMLDRIEKSELSVSKYALSRTIGLNYVF